MADKVTSVAAPASPVVSSPEAQAVPAKKDTAASKVKNPRTKVTRPSTAEMVNSAIQSLNERGGSSLQAIKKYIVATYMVDAEKLAPFIRKYLKTAVATGVLTQTKGKGASGSFKMSVAKSDATRKPKAQKAAPKSAKPKKNTAASSDAASAKKPRSPKKAQASKKTESSAADKREKTPKSPVVKSPKAKSPSKVKKAVKAPTSKPKAPKPKKAAVAAAAAAAAASPKTVKPAPKKAAASKKK